MIDTQPLNELLQRVLRQGVVPVGRAREGRGIDDDEVERSIGRGVEGSGCERPLHQGDREGEPSRSEGSADDLKLDVASYEEPCLRVDRDPQRPHDALGADEHRHGEGGGYEEDDRQADRRREPAGREPRGRNGPHARRAGAADEEGSGDPPGEDRDSETEGQCEQEHGHARAHGVAATLERCRPQAVREREGDGERRELPREPQEPSADALLVLVTPFERNGAHDRHHGDGGNRGERDASRRRPQGRGSERRRADLAHEPQRQDEARGGAYDDRQRGLEGGLRADLRGSPSPDPQHPRLDRASGERERAGHGDHEERDRQAGEEQDEHGPLYARLAPVDDGHDLGHRAGEPRLRRSGIARGERASATLEEGPDDGRRIAHPMGHGGREEDGRARLIEGERGGRSNGGDPRLVGLRVLQGRLQTPQSRCVDEDELGRQGAIQAALVDHVVPGLPIAVLVGARVERGVDAVDRDGDDGRPVVQLDPIALRGAQGGGDVVGEPHAAARVPRQDPNVRDRVRTGEQAPVHRLGSRGRSSRSRLTCTAGAAMLETTPSRTGFAAAAATKAR